MKYFETLFSSTGLLHSEWWSEKGWCPSELEVGGSWLISLDTSRQETEVDSYKTSGFEITKIL